jgi:hypothetical protein
MGVFRAAKQGHQQMRADSATRKLDDTTDAQRNGQRSPAFDPEDCASGPTCPKAVDHECYTESSRILPVPQTHEHLPSRHGVRGQQRKLVSPGLVATSGSRRMKALGKDSGAQTSPGAPNHGAIQLRTGWQMQLIRENLAEDTTDASRKPVRRTDGRIVRAPG